MPTDAAQLNDQGAHHLREGRLAEATRHLDHAVAAAPDWFLPRYNLGSVSLAMGDEPTAIAHLQQTIALEPRFGRAHFELATLLLAHGDFEGGWRAYDWRFDHGGTVPQRPGYDAPVWDGQPAPGKRLAIWREQGLGDQLQFARFVHHAQQGGLDVQLQTSPALVRLLARSFPGVRVHAAEPDPRCVDVQIPLLSLARFFGRNESALQTTKPYLYAYPGDLPPDVALTPRSDSAKRLGLVWRSGDQYPGHAARNATPSDFAPLRARTDLELYALQFDATDDDRAACAALGITDLGPALGDFATTAAIVDQLDGIVTVDTAMAHLAGGLGKTTYLLLPQPADWRWQRDRDDTPWYPHTRLFRQTVAGAWSPVVDRLIDAV